MQALQSPLLPSQNKTSGGRLNISHLGGGKVAIEDHLGSSMRLNLTTMDVSFKYSGKLNPLEIGRQAVNWKSANAPLANQQDDYSRM